MPLFGLAAPAGDQIWDTICYHGCDGEPFRTSTIMKDLQRHGFKPKTAELYFNRFVQYAMAHPEEFSGPKSRIVRVRKGLYRLEDNADR